MIIGVTGTFSSGKTTVSKLFGRLGAYVIDADKIVHELYRRDKNILNAIYESFGNKVFVNGKIDRKKLRDAAFENRKNLGKLQRIVHPVVIKRIKEKARKIKTPVVIDAPLLIEANLNSFVDYVIVVRCSLEKALERCTGRGFAKKDFLERHSWQIPIEEKVKFADFVIDNSRSKKDIKKEVEKIWRKLKRR